MKKNRIFLCLANPSGFEQQYIDAAFNEKWLAPCGPNVDAFERELEDFVNSSVELCHGIFPQKRVVAVSSGTAANHLALLAAGVEKDDEVLVQSFCFIACANPVMYCGAKPVFIDSEPLTWNMSPQFLEEAIIDRKKKTGRYPKAIMLVDLFGMPAMLDEIVAVAEKYNVVLIEDAANAFGSKYKGRMCGTFGRLGTLSFNGNKMITTSGGGALITNNEEEWREVMMYATQYRESYPYYHHEKIGYNYRMSNICAGIGRGQMTVVNDHIAHHRHVQNLYEELLQDVQGITVHSQPDTGEYESNYWLCTITLDPELRVIGQEDAYKTIIKNAVGGAAGVIHVADSATTDCQPNDNVEAMRVALDKAGIEARPLWKPMHKQPVYQGCPAYVNGISEAMFKVGMCLPSGPCVSDDDVRYIVENIKNAIVK